MHGYWGGGFLWKFGLLMILFMMLFFSKDLREGLKENEPSGLEEASVETDDSFIEDEDDFDWGPIEENEVGYVYHYN